jgi:hypothetical protein
MAPRKGTTNNPNGRPKGSRNKASDNMKQAIYKIIDDNWKVVSNDIKHMAPKDRAAFIEKMISYVMPKSTIIDANLNNINYNVVLTDEEVRQYAKALEDEF